MTSDIEKLIERLRRLYANHPMCLEAADTLTRLVAPLPAEVEALTEDLRRGHYVERLDAASMLESLARQYKTLLEWYDRLRAELETAKPLLDAAVAFQRGVDGIGQTVGHPVRRLHEAAKEYGLQLDAKKGDAT